MASAGISQACMDAADAYGEAFLSHFVFRLEEGL